VPDRYALRKIKPEWLVLLQIRKRTEKTDRQNAVESGTQGQVRNWYSAFSFLGCVGVAVGEGRVVGVVDAACCL
jgi:hypothetical protein